MTPPKDGRERGGFNKIEDIVFQFGNSQVSVIGIPAVFKKKSELLFSECPIWKAEVGDPPPSPEGLHCGLTNPACIDCAHGTSCWVDVEVIVEGFLKQFISQVGQMDCKHPKPFPL